MQINRIFKALGTVNSIFIPRCNDSIVILEAAKRVMEIDDRFSVYKEESDISMINRHAGERFVRVHDETLNIIKKSVEMSKLTDCTFDITMGPLVQLWGIGKKKDYIPDQKTLADTRCLVGYHDIMIDEANSSVMLAQRGQKIDLGAIAKGYAAEEVRRILKNRGIDNALINLGGNVIAMGQMNPYSQWTIGVQNPMKKTGSFFATIKLKDETAVTSGSNERYFIKDNKRYHHILDPRTGMPSQSELISVTLIGKCSTTLDALSTAVFILGMKESEKLLKRFEVEAVFIRNDGSVFLTKGLRNRFSFAEQFESSQIICAS